MIKIPLHTFGYDHVYSCAGAIIFDSGLHIDADGAPNAYAPAGSNLPALDLLRNAGHIGNWWGIATHSGDPDGKPVIQDQTEPFEGYYVSTTAFQNPNAPSRKTARYLDSRLVSFIVIPSYPRFAQLGDYAMLFNPATGDSSAAIVGDIGQKNKVGECSIKCAQDLSVNSNPKTGGIAHGILTFIFPHSATGWVTDSKLIAIAADNLFLKWGTLAKLKELFPEHFSP